MSDITTPGATHLGGEPDVPPEWTWPARGGLRMAFVAQVDLAACGEAALPTRGVLQFFYDAVGQPWGTHGGDRGGWQVLHLTGDRSRWRPRTHPDAAGPSGTSGRLVGRLCGPRAGVSKRATAALVHAPRPGLAGARLLGESAASAEVARAAGQAGPWRPLLSVNADPLADVIWGEGEASSLTYFITAADLAAGDFDRTWIWLECDTDGP